MASVWSLPPGFEYTTLAVGGRGLNTTMAQLGAALLAESRKRPVDPINESFVLSHLGYWVDNGAPYYHTTAAYNISSGMEECSARDTCTQEDALKAVQADARARKIPLRYMRTPPPACSVLSAMPCHVMSCQCVMCVCVAARDEEIFRAWFLINH